MLTRRLVWVAVQDGEMYGMLIAFAAHGFFWPMRLVGRSDGFWIYGLLKKAFSDALDRGYHGWYTQLEGNELGRKLARIAMRRGAMTFPDGFVGGQLVHAVRILNRVKPEAERVAC